ncbi:hypothetical protein EP331_14985 [bacterium]|nr:MAG: hypothetical protein EP331_14985 [bacterium]
MDIKSLLNNQLIDRKRSERVATGKTDAEKASNGAQEYPGVKDEVSISQDAVSDLNFAKNIYKKLDESSLDRIRTIRGKVESGDYTNESAIKNLAASVEKDIYQLESDSYISEPFHQYPVDINKLKQQLVENQDIYTEVADRLSKILSNF